MKVEILGTPYEVSYKKREEDKTLKENINWFGYTSAYTREIVICDVTEDEDFVEEAKEEYIKVVLRHELIHAFLTESGLDDSSLSTDRWAQNEEMVDWFARQWEKISCAIDQVTCELLKEK